MSYVQKKGNRVVISGAELVIYGGALPGILGTDLVNKAQLDLAITSTFEGNNNDFTGVNTFTNATGVTTNTITPATSGAGTAFLRKNGVYTTTPVALSVTQSGGHYGLSKADGLAVTLPAISTATLGMWFEFTILTACTSVGYVINTGEAGDVMIGGIWSTIANPDAANDMEFNVAASTNNTLTLGATTAAGLAGGSVRFTAISTTQWAVSGTVLGSGMIASNLFSTV